MLKCFYGLLLLPCCICLLSCNGQSSNTHPVKAFIQTTTDSIFKTRNVAGIFVGVLHNGQRFYHAAGYADTDKKQSFDSATVFEIASITKTFTAYVLAAVLKEKNIPDSSFIIPYLPDSVKKNKALDSIRFIQLLNHTSGLPRLPDNMEVSDDNMTPYDQYGPEQLFAYLQTCRPVPDGNSHYSNLGFGLAGVLAERISGKTYTALLDQYLFTPFRLGTAGRDITTVSNKAQGYFAAGVKTPYWGMNVLGPAYVLKMSAHEMLNYLGEMSVPATPLSKELRNYLLTPTFTYNKTSSIGRAWQIWQSGTQPVLYWHNGGSYGFSCFGGFLKDKSTAVIVVVNQFNNSGTADQLGIAIMRRLLE